MSPGIVGAFYNREGFPRVSGDEPYSASVVRVSTQFSPRERG